jgi:D-arabinono-1,4-lactone oxidase
MNQTFGLTPAMVQRALGDRLRTFAQARQTFDPNGRLLNDYFRELPIALPRSEPTLNGES